MATKYYEAKKYLINAAPYRRKSLEETIKKYKKNVEKLGDASTNKPSLFLPFF